MLRMTARFSAVGLEVAQRTLLGLCTVRKGSVPQHELQGQWGTHWLVLSLNNECGRNLRQPYGSMWGLHSAVRELELVRISSDMKISLQPTF